MIAASRTAAGVAFVLAVSLHLSGAYLGRPTESVQIEGGTPGAMAALGSSFADMTAGTERPVETETVETDLKPDQAEPVEPDHTPPEEVTEQTAEAPPDTLENLRVDATVPLQVAPVAQQVPSEQTPPSDPVETAAVDNAQLSPDVPNPAATAPLPQLSALPGRDLAAPVVSEAEPPETPPETQPVTAAKPVERSHVTATKPIAVRPIQPNTTAPSPVTPLDPVEAKVDPLEDAERSTTPRQSPRPATRPAHIAALAPPEAPTPEKPENTPRKQPKPQPPKQQAGNAEQNAKKGTATGTQATGAASSTKSKSKTNKAGNAAVSNWTGKVLARLKRATQTRRVNVRGKAYVRVSISAGGRLTSVSLAKSSGHAALDNAALAGARRAGSFPKPPDGKSHTFTYSVVGGG